MSKLIKHTVDDDVDVINIFLKKGMRCVSSLKITFSNLISFFKDFVCKVYVCTVNKT